jgi:hypothetical protein
MLFVVALAAPIFHFFIGVDVARASHFLVLQMMLAKSAPVRGLVAMLTQSARPFE